ncbi:MAG: hypothetical protein ACIAS6_06300 [Phycisphaerales bacterium JB060]
MHHNATPSHIARRGGVLARLLIAIAIVLLLAVILASVEVLAAVKAAPRVTTNYGQRTHDRILERQRALHGAGPNQWPRFAEILDKVEEGRNHLDRQNEAYRSAANDPFPVIDFYIIRGPYDDPAAYGMADYYARARQRGVDVFNHWRDIGVFDASADLPGLHRVVMPADPAPGVESPIEELSLSRSLARALAARMRLAAESGDTAQRLSALEEGAALARIMAGSGTMLGWLTSYAVEPLAVVSFLDDAFLYPLDDATLAAADAAIERELIDHFPTLADIMANERDAALDHVQRVYTARGRFIPLAHARLSYTYDINQAPDELLPFGDSRLSNLHARMFIDRDAATAWINEAYDLADAAATATGADAAAADTALAANYSAPTWRNPARDIGLKPTQTIQIARRRAIQVAGWRVMLAIERYRLAHDGAPPQTLADLGDLLPNHLRVDPFTGQPWHYEPTPPPPATAGWNNQPLGDHQTTWPYTLASRPLPGFETATPPFPNHPNTGVRITSPIELPMDRRPEHDSP